MTVRAAVKVKRTVSAARDNAAGARSGVKRKPPGDAKLVTTAEVTRAKRAGR